MVTFLDPLTLSVLGTRNILLTLLRSHEIKFILQGEGGMLGLCREKRETAVYLGDVEYRRNNSHRCTQSTCNTGEAQIPFCL